MCLGPVALPRIHVYPELPRSTLCSLLNTMTLSPTSYDKLYINGEYVAAKSSATLELRSPITNDLVTDKVPIAGQEDVDIAVAHAEAGFNGPWSQFTAAQRSACLRKLADLLETEVEPILTLDTLTMGSPVSLIPTRENGYIRSCLLYYGTCLSLPWSLPWSFTAHTKGSQRDGPINNVEITSPQTTVL